jgi:PAS domain S-box-containing protein
LKDTYEIIFNSVNDGIVITNINGHFLEVNQITCDDLGYSKEELLQMNVHEIIPLEFRERLSEQITEKMACGGGIIETQCMCKDGSLEQIELNLRPIKFKEFPAVLVVIRNITERKKAEEAVKVSEKRYHNLFQYNNSSVVITETITDDNGSLVDFVFREVNKTFEKDTGFNAEDVIGRRVTEVYPGIENRKNTFLDLHKNVELTGETSTTIIYVKEFEKYFNVTAYKLEKNIIGAVAQDITDRIKYEEAMLKAKVEAESANKTKSQFLATMSHELRTPLNSIIGFSDILLDGIFGDLNDKQLRYISNVSNSGKYLLGIINDILDISKIEAGEVELKPVEVSIHCLLEEMISLMQPLASDKEIVIKLEIEPQLDIITVDDRMFKQLLYNLISNAIKFTDIGGTVTIKAKRKENVAHISVIDTGIGISIEDQGKLFKPFSQLDSSLSRQYEGTGLGLAICKKFLELHHGEIWAESELGKGTTFTFTIPI